MEILFLRGAKHFLGLDVKIVESVRTLRRTPAGRRRGRWWDASKDLSGETHAGSGWKSLAAHSFTDSDVVHLEAMLTSQSEAEREMAGLILELRT